MGKGSWDNLLSGTPEALYWVGFLYADGYINHNDWRLSVRLAPIDQGHLVRFAAFLGYPATRIKFYRGYPSLDLRHSRIPDVVARYDFRPSKTYNPPYLDLEYEEVVPLLAGLIDGDGHVERRTETQAVVTLGMHQAWGSTLRKLRSYLYRLLECEDLSKGEGLRYYKDRDTDMVRMSLADNYVLVLLKRAVKGLDLPALRRKWDRVPDKFSARSEFYILRECIRERLGRGESMTSVARSLGKNYSSFTQYVYNHNLKGS